MRLREIVDGQRKFFRSGKTRALAWRREKLERLETVLVERRDEILECLAADLGKPGMEAFLCEYYFLLEEVRLVRKKMKAWLKKKRVRSPFYFQPCRSWIERHPYGVVLIMAPWNYPVQLSLSPLIAAIAAGNSVILKPSEMHSERYHLDAAAAEKIKAAQKIAAVGTTVTRVLEHLARDRQIAECSGETDIFIYPLYQFQAVDTLLTNFHLPCSTLMMLISAFASRELVLEAYAKAVEEKYRFYSYGDCMLIV
ncbi:aldehyde dehydrogenase family protein [Akkermansiaceae bacterium]|nr:aldehyde dehydrogenase family protein [Akkermansiaceae bacterium]